jgi:hypothetical protein
MQRGNRYNGLVGGTIMANLAISEELAKRLEQLAAQQQRPIETILDELVTQYESDPLVNEIPDDVEDKVAYLKALRAFRPKVYAKARAYWRKVGDQVRLALTDRDLDEQFWLIDHEGIPRLKSEQGTIELPPDPLEEIVDFFADSDLTDMSSTARETTQEYWRKKANGAE